MDGLIVNGQEMRVTVLEIKLRHVAEAWVQLERLYLPVLRAFFQPPWELFPCEVVRYFEPRAHFPVAVAPVTSLAEAQAAPLFPVWIFPRL